MELQQHNYLQRPSSKLLSTSLSSSLKLRHHNLIAAQKINRTRVGQFEISTTTTATTTTTTTTASLVFSSKNNNCINNDKNDVMSKEKNRYSVVDCSLPTVVINNNNNNNNIKVSDHIKTRNSSRLKLVRTLMIQTNHWQLFVAIVHLILYIVSPICLAARQDGKYFKLFSKVFLLRKKLSCYIILN